MRILFIGDIVGRPGREMIKEHLATLKKEYAVDFVIANYENASHGFGMTKKNAEELFSYGIDCMTGGNHTWDKKDILPLLEEKAVLRPLNYPDEVGGKGLALFEIANETLCVINLMGHHGMPMCENPFRCAKQTVKDLKEKGIENIFIDFHAEATAEKRGMMLMLEGEVCAIVGTHTHVPTADQRILPKGSAYITDVGMTGPMDSVLWTKKEIIFNRFLYPYPQKFDIQESGPERMDAVLIESVNSVKSSKIKRINLIL